ncbi:sensor histidine kinase [Lapidilactobacillus bayanensis]|uniref:sensor histidine kinase n=1 Tax=Lapidilactobacillus bayanensis TaxID=2485998 RepID=UPI000F776839|nr:histidine kinase [Lapidilactobacillus bayanensis]
MKHNLLYRVKERTKTLSFQDKMKTLFYSFFVVIAILLITVSVVFIKLVTNETYKRSREQLSVLSMHIQDSLSEIENLISDFHQNDQLQKQLEIIDSPKTSSMDRDQTRIRFEREFGWFSSQSRVTSWLVYDQNGKRIVGYRFDLDRYLPDYTTKDYMKSVSGNSSEGQWFLDKNSNRAVYVHNIFDTRTNIMKKLGTVIFTVDLSFIGDFMENSNIFQHGDFLVLSRGNQYYSNNPKLAKKIYVSEKSNEENTRQYMVTTDLRRYYALTEPISFVNSNFRVNYYIVNQQIISKIIIVAVILFLIIIIVLIASIIGINFFLNRLIMPINLLALSMREFSDLEDLQRLKEHIEQLQYIHQKDEIGSLYASFQRLIKEIDRLVIKDYKSQILTQEMETKYLMAQIDPHFLYNTLNTINWIALSNSDDEVSELVMSLALLLQEKADSRKKFNSLADELKIVHAYVRIQEVRFSERLRFSLILSEQINPERIIIPKLIIQPIVENAVKYGVEKVDYQVTVRVTIGIVNNKLVIVIFNDAKGFDPERINSKSTGVGLHNIKARLQLLYGDNAGIKIDSAPDMMTIVSIWLPLSEDSKQDGLE